MARFIYEKTGITFNFYFIKEKESSKKPRTVTKKYSYQNRKINSMGSKKRCRKSIQISEFKTKKNLHTENQFTLKKY